MMKVDSGKLSQSFNVLGINENLEQSLYPDVNLSLSLPPHPIFRTNSYYRVKTLPVWDFWVHLSRAGSAWHHSPLLICIKQNSCYMYRLWTPKMGPFCKLWICTWHMKRLKNLSFFPPQNWFVGHVLKYQPHILHHLTMWNLEGKKKSPVMKPSAVITAFLCGALNHKNKEKRLSKKMGIFFLDIKLEPSQLTIFYQIKQKISSVVELQSSA